jgi:hypothetical protein
MALEEIEINKDNLNVDTFKTLIANVAEQINIKLQNEEGISLEDIDKSVTQINNAYSMLVTVNSDTNDRDISAIEQMKVSFDNAIDDIQTRLDNGDFNGKDGNDGQSFTFDMFTPEQLDSLKVKGDDGQPFTYEMFTPEQLESLKVKGDDGKPFTYDMFTPEQLESLKVKGDDGTPFTYADLTPEQLESFKSSSNLINITVFMDNNYVYTNSLEYVDLFNFSFDNSDGLTKSAVIECSISHLLEGRVRGEFSLFKNDILLGSVYHATWGDGYWRIPLNSLFLKDDNILNGLNEYSLKFRCLALNGSISAIYYNYSNTQSFYKITQLGV